MRAGTLLLVVALVTASNDDHIPGNLKIVNPFLCKPGSKFKVDCNYCTCMPQGGRVGACTRMFCPLEQDECIPESYFFVKGQLCACPRNGYKWDSNCFAR